MTDETAPAVTCYVHPNREANLRCNRCERPICPSCAVLTPTGYRCKECIRGQQKVFDTSQTVDFPLAFFTAAVLSLIGSILASILAGLLGILFGLLLVSGLGTAGGAVTAEAVRRVIRKHRSNSLFLTAAGGAAAGALPVILWNLLSSNIWGMIMAGVYAVLVTTAVYYRLRGIQMR